MIDTEAIKTRILDFAMHGKLTKQVSEDGIAEDLYCLIQEEKKKKSKTKKNKTAVISEDEILFDIPDNWKWVHLDDIASSMLGKTLNKSTDKGENCPYLCSINVYWDGISLENVKQAKFDIASKEKYRLEKGDLLICEGGDSGRSAVWNGDEEMYYQNALHRVRFYGGINPYYFCRVFEYYKKTGIIANYTTGIGIQHLVQNSLNSIWLPLPPISEQERIVERIDEIFETLDKIDHLQNQYASNQEVLKSKLIDAGITGRLTEPLPGDGSVSELHTSILRDKERILKERNGRADKKIKEIDDNVPFDIPEHWKWIRFGDVGLFKKGPFGSALTKSMFVPKNKDTVKVYEQQHAIRKDANIGTYYITKKYFDEKMSGFEVRSGDIIVSCAGTIGETYILPEDLERGIINQALMRITLAEGIDRRFFLYYFDSNLKKSAQEESNGSAIKNIPPFDVMKNWYFPLPPIEEQGRIADKIDELLQYC